MSRTYTARQRAALPGSGYDRLVAVLKRALPAAAVALLMVIIILPLRARHEFSFMLAKDKVAMSRERLRIDNAVYRGETAKGQPFTIRARGAVQRSSALPVLELDRLDADVRVESGPATVSAPSGRYDMRADRLDVAGPVRVVSAAGYTLDGEAIRISLADRTVTTDRAVSGRLPLGTYRAGSLRADVGGSDLVLAGRAHLQITPASRKRAR